MLSLKGDIVVVIFEDDQSRLFPVRRGFVVEFDHRSKLTVVVRRRKEDALCACAVVPITAPFGTDGQLILLAVDAPVTCVVLHHPFVGQLAEDLTHRHQRAATRTILSGNDLHHAARLRRKKPRVVDFRDGAIRNGPCHTAVGICRHLCLLALVQQRFSRRNMDRACRRSGTAARHLDGKRL